MSKPYYADYVNHMLRFYFRCDPSGGFKSETDELNYTAADAIIRDLPDKDRLLLTSVFQQDNVNLAANVSLSAAAYNVQATRIWSLLSSVTPKIAKQRRLI